MTLSQALFFFVREAVLSLLRSWRVSSVAILTIAISLFMGGLFWLVTSNVTHTADAWAQDLRVLVYLEAELSSPEAESVLEIIQSPGWVTDVAKVESQAAEQRFADSFPMLAGELDAWTGETFPDSYEVQIRPEAPASEVGEWIGTLENHPAVGLVDDDRAWLSRLRTTLGVVRFVGWALAAALLGAAIFTTASVIRLTAYLYLDEIAVMRLVGATEFYVRGPFYLEGLLQGLLGGSLALLSLKLVTDLLREGQQQAVWTPLLLSDFLSWQQQVTLVLLGGTAGLLGAVLSLRREHLRAPVEET